MITSFRQLPLGRYLEILEVNRDESLTDLERQVKTLSLLSDLSEEEILHLPIAEYREMVGASRFVESYDEASVLVAKKYHIGGMDLIPVTDFRKVETAQYVDFQTFSADPEKNLVEILSTFLVPRGHRYNEGYDILDVHRAVRENLSVAEAVSLSAFFLTLCRQLTEDSLNYCKREIRGLKDGPEKVRLTREIQALEMRLRTNGDGSPT